MFHRACDFSLDVGFSGFQDTNSQDLFVLSFFFSCINTVYSLAYRTHTEKVNGLIYFLVIHDKMIAIAKKTYLKDKA